MTESRMDKLCEALRELNPEKMEYDDAVAAVWNAVPDASLAEINFAMGRVHRELEAENRAARQIMEARVAERVIH